MRECGGEGGKPGPCPENHSEGTEHGVGGKPHPGDVNAVNKRIGADKAKTKAVTDHQAQVHTDVQSIGGSGGASTYAVTASNEIGHGKAAALRTGVRFDKPDSDSTRKKINRLREYADAHGYAFDTFSHKEDGSLARGPYSHGGAESAQIAAPKTPMNDRQKDAMRMRNAAMADGEDTALHTLADKLTDMDAPIAKKLSKLVADGDYAGAREHIRDHERNFGSVLSRGGKAGMGGNSGTLTEAAERPCSCKRRRRFSCGVRESCCEGKESVRIDRKAGVIRNVLILGRRSKNKRRYTESAMEEAVRRGKYEKLQVYIGPHKRSKWAKRSPDDHAGELVNTRVKHGEIRGDLRYNRASHGGQLVLEIAERFPDAFGLSHHADVAGYEEDGEKVITRILEVAVVDVVKDPGTTETVFEDVRYPKRKGAAVAKDNETVVEEVDTIPAKNAEEDYEDGDDEHAEVEDDKEDAEDMGWEDHLKDLISEIHDDDSIDDDVKMKATKKLLDIKKMLKGDNEEDEEAEDVDEDEHEDADDDEDEDDDGESVNPRRARARERKGKQLGAKDVKRIVKSAVTEAVKSMQPRRRVRPPKSSARSEVVESVEQPKKKPAQIKDKAKILEAYEGSEADGDDND